MSPTTAMANAVISIASFFVVKGLQSAATNDIYARSTCKFLRSASASRSFCAKISLERISDWSETELQNKTVAELRDMYRKLGGTPGILRKRELMEKILPLLKNVPDIASHSASTSPLIIKSATIEIEPRTQESNHATHLHSETDISHVLQPSEILKPESDTNELSNNNSNVFLNQERSNRETNYRKNGRLSTQQRKPQYNQSSLETSTNTYTSSHQTNTYQNSSSKYSSARKQSHPSQVQQEYRSSSKHRRLLPKIPNTYRVGHWNDKKGPDDFEESWLIKASCNNQIFIEHPFLEHRDARPARIPASDIDLLFLGTASCIPSIHRGVSSLAFRMGGDIWLFDAGEGTQVQIQRSPLKPTKISKIFMTHLHGDHINGLPGLICLMGQDRDRELLPPLEIYGPAGLRMYLRTALRCSYSRIAPHYVVHELHDLPHLHGDFVPPPVPFHIQLERDLTYGEVSEGLNIFPDSATGLWNLCNESGRTVVAGPMKHTIPCVGFVIIEQDKEGTLKIDEITEALNRNAEAIKEEMGYRDHRKLLAVIKSNFKAGGTFKLPGDGTILKYDEIMSPIRRGRKIVILGDTCDASSLESAAMDADVVVHEATNSYLIPWDSSGYDAVEYAAVSHGHSTPHMAAQFAKKIRARQLILNHFSPRYHGDDRPCSLAIMERIARQAARAGDLKRHQVLTAHDLLQVPVPEKSGWADYELAESEAMAKLDEKVKEWLENAKQRDDVAEDDNSNHESIRTSNFNEDI